jgi:antitoxin (DNA-binding transcriptional repressor) of toxin-antitoxin stability system
MAQPITATEAARSFSDLLSRVHYRGESFLVVRNGEVLAQLAPPPAAPRPRLAEALAAIAALPRPDADFADDLEAIQRDQPALDPDPWQP